MPLQLRNLSVALLIWTAVTCSALAQIPANKSRSGANLKTTQPSPKIYQDDQIQLRIPEGWGVTTIPKDFQASMGGRFGFLAGGIVFANGKLLLEKDGYILALAYDTQHSTSVGRLDEVVNIPWPSEEDVGLCSAHMNSYPLPASRTLLFYDLVVDTGDPEVREACGIPKDLAYRSQNEFLGERRWLAGFFTTAYGGPFFPSAGDECGLKAYVLVSQAKTPEELPDANDPKLRATIQQAIDLVDSIHYKRCPPSAEQ